MSLRDLVEPECGNANPLMRLGSQITRDAALKDDGISRASVAGLYYPSRGTETQSDILVNEFLGQSMSAPQTFRMGDLLSEIREINNPSQLMINQAPSVMQEVRGQNFEWVKEFTSDGQSNQEHNMLTNDQAIREIWNHPPPSVDDLQKVQMPVQFHDFFDVSEEIAQQKPLENTDVQRIAREIITQTSDADRIQYSNFLQFMQNVSDGDKKLNDVPVWDPVAGPANQSHNVESWLNEFDKSKEVMLDETDKYNEKFWNRLQDEWKALSTKDEEHPWLTDFTDYYEQYKEYNFTKENPMTNMENAFDKGIEFLEKDDIPSAVLCFEVAAQQSPNDAKVWEYLGHTQAENENDPNAIAALTKSLEIQPINAKVLMALAVSYTNESHQSKALKMLIKWLSINPKYKILVPETMLHEGDDSEQGATSNTYLSTLIASPELDEVQGIFLKAVQLNSTEIDPDIQEALGVLFNLSMEYDKAVDCFQTALHARQNSKTWNRLGASLANGNRSVEAVEAYQRALELQPGFIRARYNVGIICLNLKAYKEAAEHLLTALNHQATSASRVTLKTTSPPDINNMSDTIWSTLRMTISLMGMHDLQPAVDNRDLNALNKALMAKEE